MPKILNQKKSKDGKVITVDILLSDAEYKEVNKPWPYRSIEIAEPNNKEKNMEDKSLAPAEFSSEANGKPRFGEATEKSKEHNTIGVETEIYEFFPTLGLEREIRATLDGCYERALKKVEGRYGRKQSVQLGDYKIHCTIEMEKVAVEKSKGQIAYESKCNFKEYRHVRWEDLRSFEREISPEDLSDEMRESLKKGREVLEESFLKVSIQDWNKTSAQIGYEAYVKSSGGLNYQGKPCPKWDELPEAIREHWGAAVCEVMHPYDGEVRADEEQKFVVDPDLETRFVHHHPKEGQAEKYGEMRLKAKNLAYHIKTTTPPSREQSLALTKLEEVVFWANAAEARHG